MQKNLPSINAFFSVNTPESVAFKSTCASISNLTMLWSCILFLIPIFK